MGDIDSEERKEASHGEERMMTPGVPVLTTSYMGAGIECLSRSMRRGWEA